MVYGSGLAVIKSYKSEIDMNDNKVYIEFPKSLIENNAQDETLEILLEYKGR